MEKFIVEYNAASPLISYLRSKSNQLYRHRLPLKLEHRQGTKGLNIELFPVVNGEVYH